MLNVASEIAATMMKALIFALFCLMPSTFGYNLGGSLGRRAFVNRGVVAGALTLTSVGAPLPSNAKESDDYVPKFDDLKVLYALGVTLDKLQAKLEDPTKWATASENLAQFAKGKSLLAIPMSPRN